MQMFMATNHPILETYLNVHQVGDEWVKTGAASNLGYKTEQATDSTMAWINHKGIVGIKRAKHKE